MRLRVRQRPNAKVQHRIAAGVKGAAIESLSSFTTRGIAKKLGARAVGGPVAVAGYVLDAASGAAKEVNREVDRSRQAKQQWTGETAAAAEATLDELFARGEALLVGIVDDATARVGAQFDDQFADISRTRKRFEQLRWLRSAVQSVLDSIDLVLARRLLAIAGGDPTAVHCARRTPGVELRVWTDASRVVEVRECLQDQLVDILTERIEIRPVLGVLSQ
jgi:hypothetical protein